MPQCPDCGASVGVDDNFCERCGADVSAVDEVPRCPSCGATVSEDHQFCEACGAGLSRDGGTHTDGAADRSADAGASQASQADGLLVAEGSSGQVTLFETKIRISRDDIGLHKINHLGSGDKEIPLDNITSVQLKEPSTLTKGYIQFGQSGYSESDDGAFDAASDENSVLFTEDSLDAFVELRSEIERLRNQDRESSSGAGADPTEQLQNLKELYDDGVLTDAEFEEKKQSILEQI